MVKRETVGKNVLEPEGNLRKREKVIWIVIIQVTKTVNVYVPLVVDNKKTKALRRVVNNVVLVRYKIIIDVIGLISVIRNSSFYLVLKQSFNLVI